MMAMMADWNVEIQGLVRTDANATMGIVHRQGLGKTRHIEVQYLWIQDEVRKKNLTVGKVGTEENPADMLTKFLKTETNQKHMKHMACKTTLLKSDTALNIQELGIRRWCKDLRERRAAEPSKHSAAAGECWS
jgi:hypothetical protein